MKPLRWITFSLLYLSVSLSSSGQHCHYTLSGNITADRTPLPGAVVFVGELSRGTATDSTGGFRITDLCAGRYTVEIRSLGYETHKATVIIDHNAVMTVDLSQEIRQLSEIVVQEHSLQTEHVQNFEKLGDKALAQTAGKSLGESLKQVSGVSTLQAGPGIFKPVIHGVHSQRVLILNHGIRQEGQQWGAEHAPEIDPFIASDIIVIKDASSIKYGTDALGGVIVVNPAPLPEHHDPGGTFQTIYQSNGRSLTASGMLEGGVRGTHGWGWRLQGTGKRSGDFHTPGYYLSNSGIRELNFSGAAGYHSEKGGLEIFASHFQTSLGILRGTSIGSVEDLRSAMDREPPLYTSSEFSYRIGEPRQEVSHNLLKINGHYNSRNAIWRAQYGFQNNNRQEFDIRRGGRSDVPSIDLQLNTHTLETEWETHADGKRSLCLGVTAMHQANNNIPGTQRIPFIPNFTSVSGGVFGVAKFFFPRWVADIGTRFDHRNYAVRGFDFSNTPYSERFGFYNVSATLGATFAPESDESFSTNISTAWRPPHAAELYSLGTHQSAAAIEFGLLLNDSTNKVIPFRDSDFHTEHALKWVNTYRKKWARADLQITGYANYIFNYIYLRPSGVSQTIRGIFPSLRYDQTHALFLGADLSGTWSVLKNLQAETRATLLRASDEKNDDYLSFIPSNRYEVKIRFERDKFSKTASGFFAEVSARYQARQGRAPQTITVDEILDDESSDLPVDGRNFDFLAPPDGYALVDLGSGISFPRNKVRYDVRISVENVLNTSYREYTNRFRYYADDLGRNFMISFKTIF